MRTNRTALSAAVSAALAIAACSPQTDRSERQVPPRAGDAVATPAARRPPPLPAYLDVPDGAVPLSATPITTTRRIASGAVPGGPYTLIRSDGEWTKLWATATTGAPAAPPPPVDFRSSSVIALRVANQDGARDVAPEVYSFAGTTYIVLVEGRYPPYQGPTTRIELFRIPTGNGPVGRIGFRPTGARR